MDEAEHLHSALRSAFRSLLPAVGPEGRLEERTGYDVAVCPDLPFPQMNGVWADSAEERIVSDLELVVEEVEALGLPFSLQTRAGRTPAVDAEAERLGLVVEDRIAGMVADAEGFRERSIEEMDVHVVADLDGLLKARDVVAAAFRIPPALVAPMYTERVVAAPGIAIYLGLVRSEAVSTAIAFTTGDEVGIFNVGTPEPFRGRGYGSAITARACADAFASAASFAYLQSSALGDRVYRGLGFHQVETYVIYGRPAGG